MSLQDQWISAYFDDTLTDEQYAKMEQWLATDIDHVRQFVRASALHSYVYDSLQQAEILDFMKAEWQVDSGSILQLLEEEEAVKIRRTFAAEAEQAQLDATAAAFRSKMRRLLQPKSDSLEPVFLRYLVVCVASAALLIITSTLLLETLRGEKNNDLYVRKAPVLSLIEKPIVATITQSLDAVWNDGEQASQVGSPVRAGRLSLKQGMAELTLRNGVKILVESPVELELFSVDRARVLRGKIVADVPEDAIGFTVLSGSTTFVDLGTRFGIGTNADGSSNITVLDGEVALIAGGAGESRPSQTILAGSARWVSHDGGEVKEVAYDKNFFLPKLPESSYELSILQDRPLVYWRFNEKVGATDFVSLGEVGETNVITAGFKLGVLSGRHEKGNNYALQVSDAHDGIPVGLQKELSLTTGLTLEAWVKPAQMMKQRQRFLSMRGASYDANKKVCNSGIGFGLAEPASNRHSSNRLMFSFFGVYDRISVFGPRINEWSHVAAVIDHEGQAELFINGQSVESHLLGVRLRDSEDQQPIRAGIVGNVQCYLGCNPPPGEIPFPLEKFQGGIDELVVFDRPLTYEEIHSHYRAGKLGK